MTLVSAPPSLHPDRGVRIVVADALWALVQDGLLPKTPEVLCRAVRVARITVEDLKQASYRAESGKVVERIPPRSLDEPTEQPPARPKKAEPQPESAPEPTFLCLCCNRVRRKRYASTSRAHTCADCERARTRLLEVMAGPDVVHVAFQIVDADRLDGVCCAECTRELLAGQRVFGPIVLRHDACPT